MVKVTKEHIVGTPKVNLKSKVFDILDGFRNYVFRNKEVEAIAKNRASICGQCEFLRTHGYLHCDICGCSIILKIRSVTETNNCPKNKW